MALALRQTLFYDQKPEPTGLASNPLWPAQALTELAVRHRQ